MKVLIVATSYKPPHFAEELRLGKRYRLEYLELSEQLPASYMDYEPPWMHNNKLARRLEEKIHMDFFWAFQIAQRVKRENFDVVISMSERVAVPLGMVLNHNVKHIPILINTGARQWRLLIKLLNLRKRWAHIVTYSQAEADALQRELSLGPDTISKIWTYADTEFFKPTGDVAVDTVTPFIMSQGLAKRDYPTLIRAMQKLPHVTCHISAVSAWDDFKAGYEGMEIPSNVILASYNHPSAIKTAFEKCRFVVIPLQADAGMWSAGSTSVVQAEAMGRPVVVTRLPGVAEYIKDGETGLLVKPNDPDAMAEAIDKLWQNPERATEMGKSAQQWVYENFTLQNWVDQFSSLITKVSKQDAV
ncbi:MAG: glycosyltransferase family 4 protein [Anaerolineae bacterium]|nr:glycosyltransferase family 4 protein [Anaerolineae bacterium]